MTVVRTGFFPVVAGDQISVKQAGGLAFVAKNSLQITQGGGQIVGAGNSVSVHQGGGWLIGAGGNISIDHGGGGVIAARDVRVDRSFLGIALGRKVTVDDSNVLIGSAGSLAIGALLGLVLGWFISRRH